MINQIWQAIVPLAKAYENRTLPSEKANPFHKTTDGNMEVFLYREINNQLANFLFLTMWSSREALGRFRDLTIKPIDNAPEVRKLLPIFQLSESRKGK